MTSSPSEVGRITLERVTFRYLEQSKRPVLDEVSASFDRSRITVLTGPSGCGKSTLLYLAAGCLVMALGISQEVMADVIMLPGEAFVCALSRALGREFGNVKVCFDSSLTLAAALIALLAFHKLNGVREGTLVSALAVGQLVRFYTRRLGGLRVLWLGTDGTKRSEIAE